MCHCVYCVAIFDLSLSSSCDYDGCIIVTSVLVWPLGHYGLCVIFTSEVRCHCAYYVIVAI